jgi:hypothetical protein
VSEIELQAAHRLQSVPVEGGLSVEGVSPTDRVGVTVSASAEDRAVSDDFNRLSDCDLYSDRSSTTSTIVARGSNITLP